LSAKKGKTDAKCLSNQLVPREVLVKSAWKELVKDGSFRTFINGYHHFLKKEVGP
jgi:hypothetical protein